MSIQRQIESYVQDKLGRLQPPQIVDFRKEGDKVSFSFEGERASLVQAVHALTHGGTTVSDEQGEWITSSAKIGDQLEDPRRVPLRLYLYPKRGD